MQMHIVLVDDVKQAEDLAFCKKWFHEISIAENPVFAYNHETKQWRLAQKITHKKDDYDLWLNVFVPGNLFNKKKLFSSFS